jgi:hypothetical protein
VEQIEILQEKPVDGRLMPVFLPDAPLLRQ